MSPSATLLAYFLLINFITLFAFWLDKRRTVALKSPLPEGGLLTLAALGGTFGGWRAMSLYNHKGRHHKFRRQFTFIAMVQLLVALFFLYNAIPPEMKQTIVEWFEGLSA